jgi:hypothetical protein
MSRKGTAKTPRKAEREKEWGKTNGKNDPDNKNSRNSKEKGGIMDGHGKGTARRAQNGRVTSQVKIFWFVERSAWRERRKFEKSIAPTQPESESRRLSVEQSVMMM